MAKMSYPDSATVERLRSKYPIGSRVKLLKMNDIQAPPIGTFGTVMGVDAIGSLLVNWDNGSGLSVVYGEDYAEKVAVTTICYGEKQEWTSRKEAQEYFMQAMASCDPASSECSRYTNVYTDLIIGKNICTDTDHDE